MTLARTSVFLAPDPIARKLERARDELLDLSARNHLLNMPRQSRTARTIEIVDAKASEVYRLLVREAKALTFLAGRARRAILSEEEDDEIEELAQPDDDNREQHGLSDWHSDTKLQTRLTPAGLQKRLLNLYLDARILEDEQGVNILYLALGALRWEDPHNKDMVRHAPLVLIPVSLERASAKERFRLKWRQEDCSSNLSLEAFLDRVHLLKLPAFEAGDDFEYSAYVNGVADVVDTKEAWSVLPDSIFLGFFSYAKFLMYRDLDPANWPDDSNLTQAGLLRTLLQDGFPESSASISDETHLDEIIRPADMRHIHDSDSSQVLAAHEARRGESLVIQGPPGTGKSQTIANIIGEAVADGRTVLFVSEKMAALEVVKRRLDQAGVGDACLELHSNKANRRNLLGELRRTWELGAPKGAAATAADAGLEGSRSLLNAHVDRMHRALPASGLTPYEVIGQLARIQRLNVASGGLRLEGADLWNAEDRRQRLRLVHEITSWIETEGIPSKHAWWCVGVESILPIDADRASRTAADLSSKLKQIIVEQTELAHDLDVNIPDTLRDFAPLAVRAQKLSTAPPFVGPSLGAPEWEQTNDVSDLVEAGNRISELKSILLGRVSVNGWKTDFAAAHSTLASLSGSLDRKWLTRVERLDQVIPQLIIAAVKVRETIGLADNTKDIASVQRMLEMALHIAAAPPSAPETFTSAVWGHGIDRAVDLMDAVASLEAARQRVGDRVGDAAWDANCGDLRQTMAAHGTGLLRWFSGKWRNADRTVKSLLRNPTTPLPEALKLLDEVIKGQKARTLIREGDSFGAAAFGPQWRGERSSAAPLRAVSEWMRTLGPRSTEIREAAARVSDYGRVRVDVSCLEAIWMEFEGLLGEVAEGLYSELAGNADQISLEDLKRRTEAVVTAQKICHEILADMPELVSEQLHLLDGLIAYRSTGKTITEKDELGRRCFGGLWKSAESDWHAIGRAAEWVRVNLDIRHIAARFGACGEPLTRSERISVCIEEFVAGIEQLVRDLQLNVIRLFGSGEIRGVGVACVSSQLERWAASREDLSNWVAYAGRVQRARTLGLGDVVDRLESARLCPAEASVEVERAFYWAVLVAIARDNPELARFDGGVHQGHVDEFAKLEVEHQHTARIGAMRAHYSRIPHGGAGPVGVLKAEIARRRGHVPIRQLMLHAGPAIQALKPVLMMSPLSVAQFLTPGEMKFDLLVMDEASQIQPVDAFGAITRCRQAVIVGDECQLPPTRFFARMTGGQADDDDVETAQIADIESILGLFLARGAHSERCAGIIEASITR